MEKIGGPSGCLDLMNDIIVTLGGNLEGVPVRRRQARDLEPTSGVGPVIIPQRLGPAGAIRRANPNVGSPSVPVIHLALLNDR